MLTNNVQWIPIIFLVAFFGFRYVWSFVAGKRPRSKSTGWIVFLRKLFEVTVYLVLPILLSFGLIQSFTFGPDHWAFLLFGVLVSFFGLFLMIWTRMSRGREWGLMGDVPAPRLAQNGAYAVSRHPYYIGAVLFSAGIYIQLNSLYIGLVFVGAIFLYYVMKREDQELLKEFGADWIAYKNKVGILPWIR